MKEISEVLKNILEEFSKRDVRIALAESCTGGYVSHMITNIPGASKIFERGVVTYSNESKIELLNVSSESIKNYGAVSEQVGKQMAENIRKLSKVDIGIGITGIAGPTGDTPEKPVGLVYIGFSSEKKTIVKKFIFKNDRLNFKRKVFEEVVKYLTSLLT